MPAPGLRRLSTLQLEGLVQRGYRIFHAFRLDDEVMRTSEVEIISMLIRRSESARNMVAATPGWPRIPLPTTETLASPFCDSTVRAPISRASP